MIKVFWKCYPPFIDAYKESPWVNNNDYDKTSAKQAEVDLQAAMKIIASDWATETIEEQVLKNGEPLKINEKFVHCLGYLSVDKGKKPISKRFALISKGKPYLEEDEPEIVEYYYPEEWNVT